MVRHLGDATVLIHFDARSSNNDFHELTEQFRNSSRIVFLPRHSVHWGDFGVVAAAFSGMNWLLRQGVAFEECVLFSGQDYPIKSTEFIEQFFAAKPERIFLHHSWMDHWSQKWRMVRLDHWYFWPFGKRVKFPNKYIDKVAVIRRRIPAGFVPYTGSSWWCFPRDTVHFLCDFSTHNMEFINFFKSSLLPEEYLFQMILMNSELRTRIVDDDLRYIQWPKYGGKDHPNVLTVNDLHNILESDKLFARKFDDAIDSAVLDLLDEAMATAP